MENRDLMCASNVDFPVTYSLNNHLYTGRAQVFHRNFLAMDAGEVIPDGAVLELEFQPSRTSRPIKIKGISQKSEAHYTVSFIHELPPKVEAVVEAIAEHTSEANPEATTDAVAELAQELIETQASEFSENTAEINSPVL